MGSTGPTLSFDSFYNIINGEQSKTSKTRTSENPSTLEQNPPVPVSTEEDVDNAVKYAREAQIGWAEVPVAERKRAVVAFGEALDAHKQQFAELLTREQGKPLMFAQAELDSAVLWLKEQAKIDLPEEVVEETDSKLVVTRYVPIGVAVGIVPWNFPVQLACGKIAPAMVAGNALIIKPSPFTPYCGLKLVELAQQFFPPGVLQVLSGDDSLGQWLTEHPGIDKISFTGSTATGKLVMRSAAKTLKRVTLELGGNDPAIVCEDVNIAAVAPAVATLALLNSGQICIAIKRIYVHESIYDEFRDAVVAHVKTLQVGDGFKEGSFLGPVQNGMQHGKVNELLDNIEAQGLTVAFGAAKKADRYSGKGYFINPTIIDNPADDERIVRDEPFGPVFPLMKWSSDDEVIARANDTNMGLGASVWATDLTRASKIAKQLKAGSVWVNNHTAPQPNAAFGGHKQSGIGSEWGSAGLKSYCNTQTLFLQKSSAKL